MAQISIISKNDVIEAQRFDADFFRKEYIEIISLLEKFDYYSFGEVTNLFSKGIFDINSEVYTTEGIPFVRIKNLKEMIIDNSDIVYIPLSENEKNKKTELVYGDIILSKTAYPACSLVTLKKCNTSQDTIAIKLRENISILSEFLVIFLNSKFGLPQMMRYFTGNIQMHLNLTESKQILIPKLSEKFQNSVKNQFNNSLEKEYLSKQLYKEAEQILLKELGLLDFKPKHKLTFETTKSKIEEAERFDAEYFQPKYEDIIKKIENYEGGFKIIEDTLDFNDKNFFPEKGKEYTYIPLSKVSTNGVIDIPQKELGENLPTRARRKVKVGDIVLSSIEGSIETSAIILEEHCNFIVSNGFYVFQSKLINSETLFVLFKSQIMLELLRKISKGAILGGYDLKSFKKLPIPIIKPEIQNIIAEKIIESYKLRKESKQLLEVKVCQCSFPEPYGSGFWFVFFGVIVPITPHTQNIRGNRIGGNNCRYFKKL